MFRYAVFALTLLLAACGGDFGNGTGRVPRNINNERPEAMPSNGMPQPPGSVPR